VIRSIVVIGVVVISACGGGAAPSPTSGAPAVAASAAPATVYTPANSVPQVFQWTKAPAAYPAGAEIVVMEGDTSKPGPFTLRLRFPDGYSLPPHSHPVDEHVTVIQGTFIVGLGATGVRETAVEMPAGSFLLITNRTQHYVFARGVTIVQAHGVGPSALNYVNPADDPRASPKVAPPQLDHQNSFD
jgi:quercetin dioxygenase-like cupin family protein